MSESFNDDPIARLHRFLAQEDSDAALTFVDDAKGETVSGEGNSELVARLRSALENALTSEQRPPDIREMKMAARSKEATANAGVELQIGSARIRVVEDEDAVFHLHDLIPKEATTLLVGDEAHTIERVDDAHAVVRSLLPPSFEVFLDLHLADPSRYPLRWD